MPLSPGDRLGPYEIISRLGAGGMGEVFRARDTRLGRDVAVKILPSELAGDAGRRARFEQEARAVAALNHPNVVGLYDTGEANGVVYQVTELVAGETLASLIESGPVPVRKLLDIAVQIADGMACAHAAHITHRDLKPANIMITGPESGNPGLVKILDFGLAKQASIAAAASETVTIHQTEPGMIMGTVNYMSPEQARGKPADYRSDQFSFGLILYEMATGKRPFEKPESVQTMSAILTEEHAPIERTIPAPMRWAIDRCLAKDPSDRYDSTRDLYQELRHLRDHLSEATGTQPSLVAAPLPSGKSRVPWGTAAGFVAGIVVMLAILIFRQGPPVADQSSYRFTPFSFEPGGQASAVWSPDGKSVAYSALQGKGPGQLYLRSLDALIPVQITHTAQIATPVGWTQDGQRIFFSVQDRLWSVAKVGGEPQAVLTYPAGEHRTTVSPDGQAIAIFVGRSGSAGEVWISTPPGAPLKKYQPNPFAAVDLFNAPQIRFSPDGKYILLNLNRGHGEEAWLLPYPANTSSPPRRVLTTLHTEGGTPTFSWMPDSRHVVLALQTTQEGVYQLWMGDTRSEERYALTSGTIGRSAPAVSPDGKKLIFSEGTGNYDVVSVDLSTAAVHRLIATERDEVMPAWAAKQPVLAYVTNRSGPTEIWLHSATGPDRPIVTARDFPAGTTQWLMAPALSPDGDRVAYTRVASRSGHFLWISAVAGGGSVRLTNDDAAFEFPGSWSPDGAWFTYIRARGGKGELMKVKATGQAAPVLLSPVVVDSVPVWSPTGDWIVAGNTLYSPDGKTKRSLGDHHTDAYMFSADGKVLYGLRVEPDHVLLFSLDIASGAEKTIGDVGKDFQPGSNLSPSIRFSLAPDGRSFIYGTGNFKQNLWLLEGFNEKRGLLARLGLH